MSTEAAGPLAKQALDLAKNELLVSLRFMNAAFSRLHPFPVDGATLATDGTYVRYDPAWLARRFAEEPPELARTYLHLVLHNVFLHWHPGANIDALRWDTACDIVVEHTISELDVPATRSTRATRQQATCARIEEALSLITAETVYRYLLDQQLSDDQVATLREPFYVDDHAPWHRMRVKENTTSVSEETRHVEEQPGGSASCADGPDKRGTDIDMPPDAATPKRAHASHRGMDPQDITQKQAPEHAMPAADERFADTINLDRSREQWKKAALEMGVQLDAYAKLWGVKGSNLAMNLRAVTREKQDYREFLRKFARMGEQIRINDDEFDYVFYCYGLEHYGNLPLIEPLEYAEEKRVRDFVIAIDTSASTKDGLVRRFIEKTYGILSDETSFFTHMNVHIVQCDAAVTDVTRITTMRDLDHYLDHLEIKGLGGTDFRPVFTYVHDALERGELTNLGGLVYFTDGQGTYPAHKPDYDTAFVFVNSETAASAPHVPPWAMKVILEETTLMEEDA